MACKICDFIDSCLNFPPSPTPTIFCFACCKGLGYVYLIKRAVMHSLHDKNFYSTELYCAGQYESDFSPLDYFQFES